MGLLDKYSAFPERHKTILQGGHDPFNVTIDQVKSATEVVINGRDVIMAGSNNYLGLTFDPDCIEAGRQALATHGTGTTGSRIANGTYSGHQSLENNIAKMMGCASALVYPSGYQANLGVIAALAMKGDTILIDADCHACIYDGCLMSGATIVRFRHNSPEDLDRRLQNMDGEGSNKLIIVEGLYSMFGDIAPLKEFVEVKKKHGAFLYVDEAHSLGVFGDHGRGLAEQEGVSQDVDFIVGTFSKSLGSIGGFCVSNHAEFPYMKFTSRPYMFTASISPATIGTVNAAIEKIEKHPELREKLWSNAKRLHEGLQAAGLKLSAPASPIVSVEMSDEEHAIASWNRILNEGVYVNLAIPPGTPNSKSLLRSSISAAHTTAQIDQITAAFKKVLRPNPDSHIDAPQTGLVSATPE